MPAIVQLIIRLLITAALYSFFIWALYILWQDLRNQAELLVAYQATPIELALQAAQPMTMQFTKHEIVIGRDAACDFPIEDKTVSSQHARLSFHHHQWWLEDLGSTNGTLLNLMPVTTAMVVTSGDQIACGQAVVTIKIEAKPVKIGG